MSALLILYIIFHVMVAIAFGYYLMCMEAMNSTSMSWLKTATLSLLWPATILFMVGLILIIKFKQPT